jgi:hypothetical protein
VLLTGLLMPVVVAGAIAGNTVVPVPRSKPPRPAVPISSENGGWSGNEISGARAHCAQDLKGLVIVYASQAPLGRKRGCGAPAPILVETIAGVRLDPPATLNCAMAEGLHRWITTSLQPRAATELKTQATAIHVAASYVCRNRNSLAAGKLSEHAHADALDISGIDFAGKADEAGWGSLAGKSGTAIPGSFLDEIRSDACLTFTTVLGPGSDPYHGSHLHLDMLIRHNGWRICQ